MATMNIDTLGPTDRPSPSNRYDPGSLISFIEWRPGDQALLMFRVPDDHDASGEVSLLFDELAPASACAYSWLTNTGVHTNGSSPGDVSSSASSSARFDSSDLGVAGRIVTRSITITGDDLVIAAGDIVSITLEYSCVEDEPCPEYLSTLAYRIVTTEDESTAPNLLGAGRLAQIAGEARDLFNEEAGDFLSDEFVLRAVNSCIRDIARENFWSADTWVAAVPGQEIIDLPEAVPDLQEIHRIWFGDVATPMTRLETPDELREASRQCLKAGIPQYYLVRDNLVRIFPGPLTNAEHGYYIHYSRIPPPLGLNPGANMEPPLPRAFDSIFTLFVLRQAFLRDRNAPGADLKFREYSQLYEIEKKRLLESSQPSSARLSALR
jgi:hypothetical protein